jgi:hypothetical protein
MALASSLLAAVKMLDKGALGKLGQGQTSMTLLKKPEVDI